MRHLVSKDTWCHGIVSCHPVIPGHRRLLSTALEPTGPPQIVIFMIHPRYPSFNITNGLDGNWGERGGGVFLFGRGGGLHQLLLLYHSLFGTDGEKEIGFIRVGKTSGVTLSCQ